MSDWFQRETVGLTTAIGTRSLAASGRRPPLGLGPRKLTLGYTTDFATGSLRGTGRTHIDGRPRFAKLSIDDVKKVEIAAIDPDFVETEASVPDGMR